MRVAVAAASFGGKTGVQKYLDNLFAELELLDDASKYDVYVNSASWGFYDFHRPTFRKIYAGRLCESRLGKIAWTLVVLPLLAQRSRADVLWLTGNPIIGFKSCPIVANVLDLGEYAIPDKYDRLRMFYRTKFMNPWTVKHADMILTISQQSKTDICRYLSADERRVEYAWLGVPAGYNVLDRDAHRQSVRRKYGISAESYILTVGRLDLVGKNLGRLVQAFHQLRSMTTGRYQLVIVGEKSFGTAELYKLVERLNLCEDVVFTGYAPEEDLPLLYNCSDLFVFPSLHEGFGLPVLEAMACGVPVACSNVSSIPEVAGEAALFFDPLDVSAVAGAMHRGLTDDHLRGCLIDAGLRRARQFTWRQTAEKTLGVLRAAAARGVPGTA